MTSDAVASIAKQLGFDLQRQLGGGAFGAFLARTGAGAEVVLKVLPDHPGFSHERVSKAVQCAEKVRASGYPVPQYLQVGSAQDRVFTVQEYVGGEVPDVLRLPHAAQLVDLWRQHEKVAGEWADAGRARAEDIVTGLRVGTENVFVDHAVLRTAADPRVRRVLDVAIGIGHDVQPETFRWADVVHGDFDQSNVLVRGDRVVAVFDWEGAHAGDSRADLVGLSAVPAPEDVEPAAAQFLRRVIGASVPAPVRRAVLALGALQRLTFAVRSRPDLLEWALGTSAGLTEDA